MQGRGGSTITPMRAGFAHRTRDLRYTSPCPPPPARLRRVHTRCPAVQGPGSQQQQQSHKHSPVRASFPRARKLCIEFLVKSYQTQVKAGVAQPAPRMMTGAEGRTTATLSFGHHSCTDTRFATAPSLHLRSAGCPS